MNYLSNYDIIKHMSIFFDKLNNILKDFDEKTTSFVIDFFKNDEEYDFLLVKPFITLRRDKHFAEKLAAIYSHAEPSNKQRIIKILAGLGTLESLRGIINIYSVSASETQSYEFIKKSLMKYGYGYIDHYGALRAIYKNNSSVVSFLNEIVKKSGFYEDIKDMLEPVSEKILLYALKQYHKYCCEETLDIIKKFKNDTNWMIRFNVLQVIKKIETPAAFDLIMKFLADDNIKLREEAKTFIISNYELFSDKIIKHIDEPGSISDLSYFQGVLEIFEYHPDFSKIFKIIDIISEFPEGVSLKARTVLFNILKAKLKTKELALDRDSERYKLMFPIISRLCKWNSDQAAKFISKIIDNFGLLHVDILCDEYFNSSDENIKYLILKILRDHQYFLKDRQILLELCHTLDVEGLEKFIKILSENKIKDIISSFSKILDTLGHKRTIELYRIFTECGLNTSGFGDKYKNDTGNRDSAAIIERIEALSYLKDPRLLELIIQNWKSYSNEVKTIALDSIEKNFMSPEALKVLHYIFTHEEEYEFKGRSLQLLSKINTAESTEIILKAFASPNKPIADIAAGIIVEKGRERLMNQINILPDHLKEELGNILIKNDGKFLDEIEAQISSTDPKIRNQIIKLLTYLSKKERGKILSLLKKFVKNPDPHIRADFTKLMEIMGGPEIVEFLIPLINDENIRVKANAVEVIAALNLREISNMLLPLTSHVNNRVRANAIIALYKLGNPNAIAGLSEMLRASDKWMRASATYALGEISDPRVLPLLYTVLNDKDNDVIKNALKVIKKIGDTESIKHLTKFLNHDSKAIKLAASETINHLRKETVIKN